MPPACVYLDFRFSWRPPVPELTNEFINERFAHLFEQYFDRFEIRTDGEGSRYIHAEYSHPRFKRTWLPQLFCGLRVRCVPTDVDGKPSPESQATSQA